MNYQRQSQNGTTIETIDGKTYVNGVHIETGKMTLLSKIKIIACQSIFGIICMLIGAYREDIIKLFL